MRRWPMSGGLVVLAGLLVEPGCWFKKTPPKASIVIPPAPQAKPPEPMPAPPQLPPSTPQPEDRAVAVPELPPPVMPSKPAKSRPARRAQQGGAEVPAAAPATETPASVPAAPTPSALPSLQPILGPRETAERNQRIRQYLDKARLAVVRAERLKLDAAAKQLMAQVRTFVQQAEESRKVDLVRAENLAERAEVLSRGLPQ